MRKVCFYSACVAFLGCSLVSGCMGSRDSSLEEQVHQQDMQLRQIQPVQADTWNQLQSMRAEINELKGQLEELKNAGGAKDLINRVNKHDTALRQVENSMDMNFNLGDPMPKTQLTPAAAVPTPSKTAYGQPAPTTEGVNPWSGSTVPKTPTPNMSNPPQTAYGQPATTAPEGVNPWNGGTTSTKTPLAANDTVTPPSESTWGQPTPQVKPQEPQKDLAQALYDAGLNAYNSRNYVEAQRSFSDFLKNFGSHTLVADAHYYLAECYFQRNQFSEAALAYNEVITRYAKSSRAPGAYLKQGICFSKSGQKAAAQARMQELIKKYPKSPEAARAKNFLKTNA